MSEDNADPVMRTEAAAQRAAASEDAAQAAANKAASAAEEAGKTPAVLVTAAVGGVTSLLALFVGVGLTADRMAAVFNGGTARNLIIAALILAVAAIGLGLATATLPGRWRALRVVVTVLAQGALIGSLVCGVFAASSTFGDGGRPTISKVSLVAEGDRHAVLSFTVTATGVRHDNLLRAFAIWVPTPSLSASTSVAPGSGPVPPAATVPFYQATLRPDDKGLVAQEVTVLLDRQPTARFLRMQIYWDSAASEPPLSVPGPSASGPPTMAPVRPSPPVGAQCGNQAVAAEAAACVDILLVAEVTPSSS